VFTHAPSTLLLEIMHAVGKLFPRGDRSPAIQPVSNGACSADGSGARSSATGTRRARSASAAASTFPRPASCVAYEAQRHHSRIFPSSTAILR
jgi:hypothetical protein